MSLLPRARGPVTELLRRELCRDVQPLPHCHADPRADPLADEDLQLALYLCYELHYRGLEGVDERWEWEPSLLALRARLEQRFEAALAAAVPLTSIDGQPIDQALRAVDAQDGPSVAAFIWRRATVAQVRELMVHRSAYQLKEADPHSWALPRLSGAAKAALIEIQADEYGGGRVEWIHAELFARAMRAVGLDGTYGAYLDLIPGLTLATVNLMSLFGLHRRLRGAIIGHLALFEMASAIPNRRYGDGLRRLGYGVDATAFFDEHVEADAVHEQIATVDLAGGLVEQEPQLAGSVLWGARCMRHLDDRWAAHVLAAWETGRTSLLAELGDAGGRGLDPGAGRGLGAAVGRGLGAPVGRGPRPAVGRGPDAETGRRPDPGRLDATVGRGGGSDPGSAKADELVGAVTERPQP